MTRRRASVGLEPASWAESDSSALPKGQRAGFNARRHSIELYVANASVGDIEQRTGVQRRHLYRMLDRSLAVHERPRLWLTCARAARPRRELSAHRQDLH
jgi:putative transposase